MKLCYTYIQFLVLLMSIFIIVFENCSFYSEKPKEIENNLEFFISDEVKNKFPILQKMDNDSKPENIFRELRAAAEDVCVMAHNKKPFSDKKAKDFVDLPGLRVTSKGVIWNLLPRVIAGCWNYFQMNDIHPEKEFQLIKTLYLNQNKECYSVGFMQPYIMNEILGCNKLHMLDIDWRIHFTHYELIRKMRTGSFQKENIDNGLNEIPFDWVAFNSILTKDTKLKMNDICKTDPNTCTNAILNFQTNYKKVSKLYLQLSPLHDLNFTPEKESISIIYTSNALDNVYTKMPDLKKMLSKINSRLSENQTALIIYHNGGLSMYGIYEITRDKLFPKVRTVCKDIYYVGGVSDDERTYINLDKLSLNNGKAITCSKLYKEKIKILK